MIREYRPKNFWTFENCKKFAEKCKYRSVFHKKYRGGYKVAKKNNWLDLFNFKDKRLTKLEADKRFLYSTYKYRAKKYNIEFSLSFNKFIEITSKECYYCNCKPMLKVKSKSKGKGNSYKYNGLDRVNNNKGYIISNIVPCCKICNSMKLNLTKTRFINHIKKIYNNLGD